jgi:histidinol-phosphate aminotransferase
LKKAGILVRYFSKPRIDDCLRITIGTEAECEKLIEALKTILG